MPVTLKVSGDPRRPSEVRPFVKPKKASEPSGDLLLIGALILGMVGLLLKYHACAWVSMLLTIASIANARSAEIDIKQVVSTICFALFGIVSSFLNAAPPPKTAKAA
mmetsp:Transcript_10124/g.30312  ORF Transcript_10124/g.30312 Transcript_10124/m.30312 type:complete len:107 (-) Transcript_10124:2423-2743(-)